MGRVYDEQCPHCSEDLEILAPQQGMKSFSYTCPYCKYKFDVLRDKDDIIQMVSRTEKFIRYVLWGAIIIFTLWVIWSLFFFEEDPEGRIMFDVNIPAQVYINDVYIGQIYNKEIPYDISLCELKRIHVIYEDFSFEKVIDPCKVVHFSEEYASYIVNTKKSE